MQILHFRTYILVFILCVHVSAVAQKTHWRSEFSTINDTRDQLNWVFDKVYTENEYPDEQSEILEAGFKLAQMIKADSNMAKMYLSRAKYAQRNHNIDAAWADCQQAKILFLRGRHYDYAAEVLFVQCQLLLHQGEEDSIVNMLGRQSRIISLAHPQKQLRLKIMLANGYSLPQNKHLALAEYQNVVVWAKALHDTSTLLAAYSNIGGLNDNSDSMLMWYRKILSLSDPEGQFANRYVKALYMIGYEYLQRDGILKDSALFYFLEAEKYADKVESPVFKMNLYNAIGVFFTAKNEHKLALLYCRKSFQHSSPSFAQTNITIINLASAFIDLNQFDSGYYYLQLGKKQIDETQRDYDYLNYYQVLAEYELGKGDSCSIELERNYIQALKYAAKLENGWHGLSVLSSIIPCLIRDNEPGKEERDIARAALEYCAFFYKPIKEAQNQLDFSEFLKNYAALEYRYGSKEKAADLYRELSENLTLLNQENYAKGMDEMLIKYKSEIKDGEIAFGKKTNMLLIAGLVLLFIVGLYIFINFQRIRILNKQITEQKAALESLTNTQQVMFSVISHDLRAPINSLHSVINILGDDDDYAHRMPEYKKLLSRSLDAADGLLNNLLLWTSTQMHGYKIAITLDDIHNIIQENIELFDKEVSAKNIVVTSELKTPLLINTDHSIVRVILRNLLSNAIKFTPNGGTIWLNGERVQNGLKISIRDSGVGISKENLDKLFDKANLHTTSGTNKEKGTGIGLSLCYELVQLLGGKIAIESQVGSGALFIVTIPVA